MEVEVGVEVELSDEMELLPGDLPNPGGPRPHATPPGALTTVGLHAVDGGSSSAGDGSYQITIEASCT